MTKQDILNANKVYAIPPSVYLWLAILIFGAASAVTRKLTNIGAQHLIDGKNPISFCNVLFVGNICALGMFLLLYRQHLNIASFKNLSQKTWINLSFIAVLSGALAPGLIFIALNHTVVANVILIGRIETPLVLALSIWFLKEEVDFWTIVGAIISFVGVGLTVFLPEVFNQMAQSEPVLSLGKGEIMAFGGACALAISTVVSKKNLQKIPLGIVNIVRTAIGTVVFFVAAIYLYGIDHFSNVFSPFLWRWMLVYSAVIVVLGQVFWLTALRRISTSRISLATSFIPVAGILFAFLILNEVPTAAQCIGGSVVLLGILVNQYGIQRQHHADTSRKWQINFAQEIDGRSGFKGM